MEAHSRIGPPWIRHCVHLRGGICPRGKCPTFLLQCLCFHVMHESMVILICDRKDRIGQNISWLWNYFVEVQPTDILMCEVRQEMAYCLVFCSIHFNSIADIVLRNLSTYAIYFSIYILLVSRFGGFGWYKTKEFVHNNYARILTACRPRPCWFDIVDNRHPNSNSKPGFVCRFTKHRLMLGIG